MKPIVILPPDTMSAEDIQMLRENNLCVVVATEPSSVKFIDSLPASSSRTQIEHAAIQLSRKLLHGELVPNYRGEISALFVRLLSEGTALSRGPTQDERDEEIQRIARETELRRLGREEAKAMKAAKKSASKSS